ncbi:MAG: L,D-transpeptidase [Rikenellaceae bacterium]|nr:L,D-transpeptidase [Rikenellaceae bacterium]
MNKILTAIPLLLTVIFSCRNSAIVTVADKGGNDSVPPALIQDVVEAPYVVKIEKQLIYDNHTLDDIYPYQDTTREFQWNKIKGQIEYIETFTTGNKTWRILQNRRNSNGEAPLVKNYRRNAYKLKEDTLGVERYQSVPLYTPDDMTAPERYGRDGFLVEILRNGSDTTVVKNINFDGEWLVPSRYVKTIDTVPSFNKIVFVDRQNQNIATLEKDGDTWLVRSMNSATTGVKNPPYAHETPLGIFVIQEKKTKMIFLKDGSTETGGYAPWASRFCNGAYVHGVPVNAPSTREIEFSQTLGTIPRSHMCVRNATSHAKFVYDWSDTESTLVAVIE